MWENITNIFQLAILGLLAFFLFKNAKIRFISQKNYVHKRFGNKRDITYKKFHGVEYYHFRVKKNEIITVSYDVSVEEGSLRLEWRDRKDLLHDHTFFESESVEFSFTAKRRIHYIKLEANQTRGGVSIEMIRKNPDNHTIIR
ncbi:hypothetical protein [Oceanobacillus jeddahense]|uniref:Uncharacterized protein n=1 Tax=Oceanobacillus jeddahense TaxID=1462527 RepID=A0ABY5JLM2_9BACI|nr:hypothetical protein [Oceanobacillus jeddahense]UUI01205.1 hypothetical protein NP439_14170 [Oceanobacillus jeddahense]